MSKKPFTLISWHENFLKGVIDTIFADTHPNNNLSQTICIFPHTRPQRYMAAMLRRDARFARPLLLPTSYTVSNVFSRIHSAISRPRMEASLLDRVGLTLSLFHEEPSLKEIFASSSALFEEDIPIFDTTNLDPQYFFPWGVKLVSLFEECFVHAKEPQNFLYGQEQVTPFAATLLENIGQLFSLYTKALDNNGWTTAAYDAFCSVRHIQQGKSLPSTLFDGKQIIIGGFFALTGTEDALFRHIFENYDAKVVLHGDPLLAEGYAHDSTEPAHKGATNTRRDPLTISFTDAGLLGKESSQPPLHARKKRLHWSCYPLRDWAKKWDTSFELLSVQNTKKTLEPSISYVEGYDLHTQLDALHTKIFATTKHNPSTQEKEHHDVIPGQRPDDDRDIVLPNYSADTAIILPESNLLMPTLHHLPHTDINISMGYPLVRSPLFRLIDRIFALQESRRSGGYYWKDLVELVRHPYLKMLAHEEPHIARTSEQEHPLRSKQESFSSSTSTTPSSAGQFSEKTLRKELHKFEQTLRESNRSFAQPKDILELMYMLMPEEDMPSKPTLELLLYVFDTTLQSFENISSLAMLSQAMSKLCTMLLQHGMPLWKKFPVDAECLYRLSQSITPELARSTLAHEKLSSETIFLIARQLLQVERVPFDAAPLVGMQVMGMLETRLLNFKKVHILDATDDNLPGVSLTDPLLPEALRPEIGLPSLKHREVVAGYHFYRLLAGADEVSLYWQEGASSSGIQDSKQKRSRFVEELLWEEEKKQQRILSHKGTDGPLTTLSARVTPLKKAPTAIEVTPYIRNLLTTVLERPVSASLLDSYLKCPVRFFYENLLKLYSVSGITEDSDPLLVGTLLHKTLQEFYEPHVQKILDRPFYTDALPQLKEILYAQQEYKELSQTIPADSFAMLSQSSAIHLERYINEQPDTSVIALEHVMNSSLTVLDKTILLTGTIDRIDKRESEFIVLDYKSGQLPFYRESIWKNETLFESLESWNPLSCNKDTDPLLLLAENIQSIQLPFYLYLLYTSNQEAKITHLRSLEPSAMNAGWIALASDGKEYTVFSKEVDETTREYAITGQIPALVNFIIRHMATTTWLYPRCGKHCAWCPAIGTCHKGI